MPDSLRNRSSCRLAAIRPTEENVYPFRPHPPSANACLLQRRSHLLVDHSETLIIPRRNGVISASVDTVFPSASQLAASVSTSSARNTSALSSGVPALYSHLSSRPCRRERLPSDSSDSSWNSVDSQPLLTPPITPPPLIRPQLRSASPVTEISSTASPGTSHFEFNGSTGTIYEDSPINFIVDGSPISGNQTLLFQCLDPLASEGGFQSALSAFIDPHETGGLPQSAPISPPPTPLLRSIELPAESITSLPADGGRLNRFDPRRRSRPRRCRAHTPHRAVQMPPTALGLSGIETSMSGTVIIRDEASNEAITWVHFPDNTPATPA